MYVKEECWLFGLHFEPLCHEPLTFGSMFQKKHVPPMHAYKPRHTHTSHVHTHNTMYAHVYTCTHCKRKGHLAKFCYYRLNDSDFTNRFIWVRKGGNPMDPIEYGYQNPLLWALTRGESVGALKWMRFELYGDNFGCIIFKEIWWEDHQGLEI